MRWPDATVSWEVERGGVPMIQATRGDRHPKPDAPVHRAPAVEPAPDACPEGTPGCLRVLVVDDYELVRRGLVALLDHRQQLCVVAEADSCATAIEAAQTSQPDLVVMDVRLPDGSGIEATREIRAAHPATRVVMLTSYPDEEAVFAAILAGASGYLLKQVRGRDLVAALGAVGRGELLLDPVATAAVLHRLRRLAVGAPGDSVTELSRQEQRVLRLIAEGKTNRQIAAEILLSEITVKHYVSSILAKLGLHRRTEAAAFAMRHRLPGAE